MLDHSKELSRWRRVLTKSGALYAWQIDELEDHLRSELEAAFLSGASHREAWQSATTRLGSHPTLVGEYQKETIMNPLSKLLGVGFSIALLGLLMASSETHGAFLDLRSMLFVLALVGGGLVAGFGPLRVLAAFRASLAGQASLDPVDARVFAEVFRRGYRLSWASGAIGVIVGIVLVLANLGDPSQIGSGSSLAILTLLYGALLAELCFANLSQWLAGQAKVVAKEG